MRRGTLWSTLAVAITVLAGCASKQAPLTAETPAPSKAHGTPGVPAEEALARLVEGNERFREMKSVRLNVSRERLAETSKGQHPFAIILGCSDSRVPVELIFDTGIGDLFVARVAGNIADDAVLGSIEYAVEHLGCKLVLVLGHERCGAVAAAVDAAGKDIEAPGHIEHLVAAIEPAVAASARASGDRLDEAVHANVGHVVQRVSMARPILSKAVKSGHLKVVGARYDLDTGAIEWLDQISR